MRILNLINLITRFNLKNGCELGTHNGDLLFALLDNLPFLSMIGIDIWDKQNADIYDEYQDIDWQKMYEDVLSKAKNYGERVSIIKGLTCEVVNQISDNSLDFIFIDANHSYPAVKQDINLWTPKVIQSGLITGHDFGREGVNQAIDETFGLGNIAVLDEVWYIQKKSNKLHQYCFI